MSRYHPTQNLSPIFDAAEHWKTTCLLGQQSIFGAGSVWSDTNISAINKFFVQNLDSGEGSFLEKLHDQLKDAPAETKILAAEMLWFMLLCSSNIGAANKRDTVCTIWDWSNNARPSQEPWLTDDVLAGIGSTGTAFNMQRWRELVFFVRFIQAFRAVESERQNELLANGWELASWMQEVPEADSRQLRHMILYLIFPDDFERIFSRTDQRKLLFAFTDLTKPMLASMSAYDMSQEIRKVRREQEQKLQTTELDFYLPPLEEQWKKSDASANLTNYQSANPFQDATANVQRHHVLAALSEIDRDGYPASARSSTYDLIYQDKRYPPKYVLSISARYANGEEFPRQYFSGGKDSQAFRVLTELGFHIEIKSFIPDLIRDFLAQADESSSLAVAEYPKEYRGLKVNVSFGKGNFAKVPWISFTGYGQTTSEGIYPVLLYYKSIDVLIVAHGISETHSPEGEWTGVDAAQTVASYLRDQLDTEPERYGASYVCEASTSARMSTWMVSRLPSTH